MTEEKLYGISFKITKELLNIHGAEKIFDICSPSICALGKKIPIEFHYFTFDENNYELKILTLKCFNRKRNNIYLTVPESKIPWATRYIKKLNQHLSFGELTRNGNQVKIEIIWNLQENQNGQEK